MRVLIDTNVLISAALSANGTPYQAYVKAASYPNHGLICEQNVDEIKRIFNKKFPNRLAALDKFLSVALLTRIHELDTLSELPLLEAVCIGQGEPFLHNHVRFNPVNPKNGWIWRHWQHLTL